jgi:hypothetical protein
VAARQAENVMMLLVDPAALGGLAGLIAVASWAIGRAHGPLPGARPSAQAAFVLPERPVPESEEPDRPLAAPCQQRALEERRAAFARPFVLAELHAEASAIRRDERILGAVPGADALIVLTRAAPDTECRFIGLSGQPTCPAATRQACAGSAAGQSGGAQPSPDLSSLTRV